ncbi:hypothetical protein [Streptomyces thermodiastaticus]|uniref:hypothetical protein n=1 Tax=Streptomyces thermodiastaticus TaxID=44061 RepID=UPI0016790CAB|nr:hypothetical protein [Streptomyces thermodiastaticus]MCE7549164.1 hypothetical protein [Streptomyces thermodiastaticus]GHF60632.1 hypothetical protein GCM10018787_06000 [Streptomyces thermodiastaticus]
MALALTRQFVWTVIPSGRAETSGGRRALFSVVLTPRLLAPPGTTRTVGQFGMQSWPSRLEAMGFAAYRGDQRLTLTRMRPVSEDGQPLCTPDQQLSAWRAMFPASLPVRPYRPTTYRDREVVDFPADEASTDIRQAYTRATRALALTDARDRRQRAQREEMLREIARSWQAAATPSDRSIDAGSTPPLVRAYEFYRRQDPGLATPLVEDETRTPDFHDVVARLAGHPLLLRLLGLVIDFAVPVAELASTDGPAHLRLEPSWPVPDPGAPSGWADAHQDDLRPTTAYSLAGSRFVPLMPPAAGTARPQGMLPLAKVALAGTPTTSPYTIMPFDVDGAALRMVSVARSDRGRVPSEAADAAGLPALRSTGFALIERGRRDEHTARTRRAADRDTAQKLQGSPLTAENLLAGYRLDVFAGGRWHSLCQRWVRYTVGGVVLPSEPGRPGLPDEGFVPVGSAVTSSAEPSAPLFIHETVARWDGWSQVVPRPDRVVDPAAAGPPPPFGVAAKVVDGSLPRLTFGTTYRFRARLVDLAGGGLRRDQPGAEDATKEIVHRRFEPHPPPELVPTAAYVDGAGPDRMVVRTERGTGAAAYAAAHGYPAAELRYLFPPKSSLELALQYGDAFSTAFGPGVGMDEVRKQFEIATRADKDVADITGARLENVPDGSGTYVVVPSDPPFPKPAWLVDPGTIWVNLRSRPRPIDPDTGNPGKADGFDSEQSQSPWRGTWPDMVPFELRIEPAVRGCAIRRSPGPGPRTFTVSLGPAEQVTVDIPSCPSMLTVPDLGIPHWAGATQDTSNPVNVAAEYGRNPLVSPPRTVTMVHAVQRPLAHPAGRFLAERHMGDTDAEMRTSEFSIDVRSTGRIDVQAEWDDVEDIAPGRPVSRRVVAHAGSFEIAHKPPLLRPPHGAFPPMRHEFGDTRRRKVRYTVTAISRFSEYFGRVIARDPQACTVTGRLEVTDVASTSRPPLPHVRHLVPSVRWTRSVESGGTVIRSRRSGGGLRVMLERPWFVTGADEALAVLVWPRSSASPTDRQRRLLSLAGRDPLQATATPSVVLDETHLHAEVSAPVTSPELGGVPVVAMAVRLDVGRNYDEGADCWFADLDLAPLAAASYRPFVRLALARYQENTADPGQRLSPPLVTEPIRLLPPRELVITRAVGRASVVLSGPGPSGPPFTTVRAELQAFAGDRRAARDGLIGPSAWTTLAQATGRLGDTLVLDLRPADGRPMRIAVTETESAPGAAGEPACPVYADIAELT